MPNPRTQENLAPTPPVVAATAVQEVSDFLPATLQYKDQGRNLSELGIATAQPIQAVPVHSTTRQEHQDLPSTLTYKDQGRDLSDVLASHRNHHHHHDEPDQIPSDISYKDQGRNLSEILPHARADALPPNPYPHRQTVRQPPEEEDDDSSLDADQDKDCVASLTHWTVLVPVFLTSILAILLAVMFATDMISLGNKNDENDGSSNVRRFNDQLWVQLGQDLDGDFSGDQFGHSVDLSADGTVLAVGADEYDADVGKIRGAGLVRILRYNANTQQWNPVGQDLVGQGRNEEFGFQVRLSGDGLTVLATAPFWNDTASDAANIASNVGQVRILTFNATTQLWQPLGQPLSGTTENEEFGMRAALAAHGRTAAVGNRQSSPTAIVYTYNVSADQWEPQGQPIRGVSGEDMYSVALSADGYVLAVGSPDNSAGRARTFRFDPVAQDWIQMGQVLVGSTLQELFGFQVDLNAKGDVLAVGIPFAENERGQVNVYQLNDTDPNRNPVWVPFGEPLLGDDFGDRFGSDVALTDDGMTVAVGAWQLRKPGRPPGMVKIYRYLQSEQIWLPLGQTLRGEGLDVQQGLVNASDSGDLFGGSVALATDGSILAAGGNRNDGSAENAGHVRVFQLQ